MVTLCLTFIGPDSLVPCKGTKQDEESEECYRKRRDHKRGDDHKEFRHNGDHWNSRHQDDHESSRRNDEHRSSMRNEKLKKKKNATMNTSSSRMMFDEEGVRNSLLLCSNYLPDEMLMAIFCHVDYRTLLNCRLVCRRWRMLIEENKVWQKKRIRIPVFTMWALWLRLPPSDMPDFVRYLLSAGVAKLNLKLLKVIIREYMVPTYNLYANEIYDEYGFPKNKILEKYGEEIDSEKKNSFVLSANNAVEFKRRQIETVKQRLANIKIGTLQIAEPKLASEHYNEEELAKFKKPKKKVRKIRTKKKLKADDLVAVDNDYLRDFGSRRKNPEDLKDNDTLDIDDLEALTEDLTGLKLEEEEDKELELHLALKKTYRLKEGHSNGIQKTIETIKQEILNSEEN